MEYLAVLRLLFGESIVQFDKITEDGMYKIGHDRKQDEEDVICRST